ncbi:MAG TPA: hypothetical protein VFU47_14795 [Armatimonadota bacterium]|nr:hypothetical protein [Armatimonadota bacterium]
MKPVSVINHGDDFVTLRATTDRPGEIQEALAAREVQHVFKGDQNQAWDAILANHCLSRAVGDSGAEITFFVQDERLGTSDARLARYWRGQGRRYVLTEDYYRGRSGAVWEHQDTSYGLFFTEAVSPEQFAGAAVHLHRAAELWEKHSAAALADSAWLTALSDLGVVLPRSGRMIRADRSTRLGPAVNREGLAELAGDYPVAGLYYAFTKTDGLYGVVPVENDNVTLSSIPAADPELRAAGQWLLLRAAAGAMRLAGSAAQRRGVKSRARKLAAWAGQFLAERPGASVTDFQAGLGLWLTGEVFPADRIELDRTSRFTHMSAGDLPRLRAPEETLHFFLDLSLRYPREFTDAYNEALNRVGFGLQRMKYDPRTGRYTPPFFVEFAPDGEGTPVYRYGLELSGTESTLITLQHNRGDIELRYAGPVRSALDLFRALIEGLERPQGVAIVGKAAAFAAELQRAPRGLGLPRQGSKYAPMVDHLISGLRARGVLDQPTGLLIRIGLNALDRLDAMGDLPLRLPRFLQGALGARATCRQVARKWRDAATHARCLLELLSACHFGQHVHLVKAMALNARGGAGWPAVLAADARLRKLAAHLESQPEGAALLRELGRDLPESAVQCIERLTRRREELLAARRTRPRTEDPARERERELIECQLLLLFAAYVRRLWQRAESLPYLNDRPYTLALYLLFGGDIFAPICREVEFDIEYLSFGPFVRPEPALSLH